MTDIQTTDGIVDIKHFVIGTDADGHEVRIPVEPTDEFSQEIDDEDAVVTLH